MDSILREETGSGNAIQPGLDTKWLRKLVTEEIKDCLREKKEEASRRVTIDFSKLPDIREDAALTREKLIVDEELDGEEEPVSENVEIEQPDAACPLDKAELRLMRCLLYGGELSWIREEGLLASVLVDGINEKLFDCFGDTVLLLDTEPELIEDYRDQLKEMVAT